MKTAAFWIVLGLIFTTHSKSHGQTGIRPPQGWSLGLMGGAAAFSDMHRGSVEVLRLTPTGAEARDLSRRVGAETSTVVGGYLSFWPSRNWGLRLHGTFAPTRFESVVRTSSSSQLPDLAPDSVRYAGLHVATAELHALFRLPTIKNRVLLYGIVGGGIARYQAMGGDDPVPPEAAGDFDGGPQLQPGGIFGLGAMLPFRNRAFRLHFELTDQVSATPIQPEATVEDDSVELTNAVRFMVGASWSPKR
jgi:hypothetical protein